MRLLLGTEAQQESLRELRRRGGMNWPTKGERGLCECPDSLEGRSPAKRGRDARDPEKLQHGARGLDQRTRQLSRAGARSSPRLRCAGGRDASGRSTTVTAGVRALLRYQFDFSLGLRVQMPDAYRTRLESSFPTGSHPYLARSSTWLTSSPFWFISS